MSIGTVIIGLVLAGAGALIATVLRNKLSNKAVEVQFMKTTTLAELKQVFADMAGLSAGFRQYVELQGVSAAANPPQTPYSKQEVAFYTADLIQVYEAEEYFKDDQGRQQRRIVRREETVSSEKSVEPLLLKDPATGESVTIDMEERQSFELVEACDRFEPTANMGSFGFFSAFTPRQLGNRTLGYRMVEHIIPLGQPLYVLGDAYQRNNEIYISRPADSKKTFVASTKSEAQIVRDAKSGSKFALIGGIVLAVGGIVVTVMGFFS